MFATFAVAAITAFATVLAPASAPTPAAVCGSHLDGGVLRPGWCGKKPPPQSYEKFRKGLVAFVKAVDGHVESEATAIAALNPLDYPCKHNPPVDQDTVEITIAGLQMNGGTSLENARKALATMSSAADAAFAGQDDQAEVKAVLSGLKGKMNDFEANMNIIQNAGDLYLMNACDLAGDAVVKAADDLVSVGSFVNHSMVNLGTMLGATLKPCKSATVKDPYSDKALKKASGASSVKSVQVAGMTMDYPTSLDLGGTVWLPLNLDSSVPSGYVQVALRQGSKPLAAIGGGTPEGESGLLVKVLGKAKKGTAKLELTFSPAGGTEASRTVKVRLG